MSQPSIRSDFFTQWSRRKFIGNCLACAGGMCAFAKARLAAQEVPTVEMIPTDKTKVRLIFAYSPSDSPIWPNIGYDFESRKSQVLKQLSQGCPGIEWLPSVAHNVADAKRILDKGPKADGNLVALLGLGWDDVPETVAATGQPTIFMDDLYGGSGKFLITYAKARRNMSTPEGRRLGWKVVGISSSRINDTIDAANRLACLKRMQASVILQVGSGFGATAEAVEKTYGTRVLPIEYPELNQCYQQANPADAQRWADRWIKEAEKVIEPSREEIEKSAAMYVGMKELMRQKKAQAITINCLGGFYGKKITAYPCLGFFQLNNDGLVGACESDLRSTVTMLLMGYLTGRPGYISDPVLDTSKNQIIYAHCVGSNRVYGPKGPANPYHIRDHSEDRKGASVRSLMPLGELTTTVEFDPEKKQVIFHQAKTVANIDEDKACRTKLAAEVKGDIEKLMNYWDQWGWHRVTYFGDLKQPVQQIAALTGFEVIEEA
jgi:hypothetical protein